MSRRKNIHILSFTCMLVIVYINILIMEPFSSSVSEYISTNYSYVQIIKSVSSSSSPVMITFTNAGQLSFVKSFICNLQSIGGPLFVSQLVVVVADRNTMDELAMFNKDVNLVLKPYAGHGHDLDFGTPDYVDFIQYRTETVLELLSAGISLLLTDSDHYWSQSPLPWLASLTNYDIVTENAQIEPHQLVCGGFLFLNSTAATVKLWKKVDQQTKFFRSFDKTRRINEQDVLSRVLPSIGRQDTGNMVPGDYWAIADRLYPPPDSIRWRYFPSDKFVSGLWYNLDTADNSSSYWSIHNNWIVGNSNKMKRAKERGHWFLQDDTEICKE